MENNNNELINTNVTSSLQPTELKKSNLDGTKPLEEIKKAEDENIKVQVVKISDVKEVEKDIILKPLISVQMNGTSAELKTQNLVESKPMEILKIKEGENLNVQVVKLSEMKEIVEKDAKKDVINLQMEQVVLKQQPNNLDTLKVIQEKKDDTKVEVLKVPIETEDISKSVISLKIPDQQLNKFPAVNDETKIIKIEKDELNISKPIIQEKKEDAKVEVLKVPVEIEDVSRSVIPLQIPDQQFNKFPAGNNESKVIKDELNISKSIIQEKEEAEAELKTAIEMDETLSALNFLQISILILITVLHSLGILIIAFFFSIYQIFLSIFHIYQYCREHPWKTRYGYQALRYGYSKEWWTFKGLYRWLTEPPPPPIFAQRTLSGEIRMDPKEAEKLEALRKKKMFHQKRLNGEFTIAAFQPPPQILEFSKKKKN